MRYFAIICFVALGALPAHAQGLLPGSFIGMPTALGYSRPVITDTTAKKWSLTRYSSITTGISVFKGGSASFVAAPIGLQLNRRLNQNLYAFAGVSVAPAYVNFRQSFLNNTAAAKSQSFFYQPNGVNVYSRAELGLMYTNDQHTFQISGSIGVERSSYPAYNNFLRATDRGKKPIGLQ